MHSIFPMRETHTERSRVCLALIYCGKVLRRIRLSETLKRFVFMAFRWRICTMYNNLYEIHLFTGRRHCCYATINRNTGLYGFTPVFAQYERLRVSMSAINTVVMCNALHSIEPYCTELCTLLN